MALVVAIVGRELGTRLEAAFLKLLCQPFLPSDSPPALGCGWQQHDEDSAPGSPDLVPRVFPSPALEHELAGTLAPLPLGQGQEFFLGLVEELEASFP